MNFHSVAVLLNNPYPLDTDAKRSLKIFFSIGVFVAAFLLLFQPWGIWNWRDERKTLYLIGFGGVSTIMPMLHLAFSRLLLKSWIQEDRWTVGKQILSVITIVSLIAAGNFVYAAWIRLSALSIDGFIFSLTVTLLIAVFPVAATTLAQYRTYLQRNAAQAARVNEHLAPKTEPNVSLITLVADNGKDTLTLMPAELIFIESSDNASRQPEPNGIATHICRHRALPSLAYCQSRPC
jgi:hypothetical protein